MKNPFKKLSDKVKRRLLIAVVTAGLSVAGLNISEPLLIGFIDTGIDIWQEVQADD